MEAVCFLIHAHLNKYLPLNLKKQPCVMAAAPLFWKC